MNKKKVINSDTVDYIADINIYLSYLKLIDNIKDEKNIFHLSSERFMRIYGKKLRKNTLSLRIK